jgi:hypothetical protein
MLLPSPEGSRAAFSVWMGTVFVIGSTGVVLVVRFVGVVTVALQASAKANNATSRDAVLATIDRFKAFKKKTLASMLAVLLALWLMVHEWAVLQVPYLLAVRGSAFVRF